MKEVLTRFPMRSGLGHYERVSELLSSPSKIVGSPFNGWTKVAHSYCSPGCLVHLGFSIKPVSLCLLRSPCLSLELDLVESILLEVLLDLLRAENYFQLPLVQTLGVKNLEELLKLDYITVRFFVEYLSARGL